MKITRLTSQKNNTERVNVFVDGSYRLSLTKDQLLSHRLFIDKEITDKDLEKLTILSGEGLLRSKTIEWLFIRPRSEKELKLYLLKKKVDPVFAQKLITEMKDKKYQDDVSFCNWWVDQRLLKNSSLVKMRAELYAKGIEKTVIEQVLSEKNIDEADNLTTFIAKKSLLKKYPDQIKLKKYLLSKGYNYETINNYFNQQD